MLAKDDIIGIELNPEYAGDGRDSRWIEVKGKTGQTLLHS